ncbi:MAG: hypothetical protein AAF829_02440 [Pseudomonadota bacterium]
MTKTPVQTPFNFFATAAQAALQANIEAQETMFSAMERASKSTVSPLSWVSAEVPVPNPKFYFDEEVMREGFQKLADANLSSWEHAADMLQALPNWASWPTRVPGTVMTDMFDRMRRAGLPMMAANDSWATAAENFSPPAFWKTSTTTKATAAPVIDSQAGPSLLDTPDGEPDDLTRIKGIGTKLSSMLHDLGIYHFHQIAAWTKADGEWIDDKLAFKNRVTRENWIEQAKALAAETAAA